MSTPEIRLCWTVLSGGTEEALKPLKIVEKKDKDSGKVVRGYFGHKNHDILHSRRYIKSELCEAHCEMLDIDYRAFLEGFKKAFNKVKDER